MTSLFEVAALLLLIVVSTLPAVRVKRTWSDAPERVRRFRP